MVTAILNFFFGCRHKRLTRPMTPRAKPGADHQGAYVACLDCGRQFHYDVRNMSIGKPVDKTVNVSLPKPQTRPQP